MPPGSGANDWVADDDEEMQRFVPIEDLFKGRHFDRQIIVLCVSWYTSFKLSLRSGDHDGRPRHFRNAYNDSPVGPALPAGVREALVALRSTRRRIVEDGRDLYKGSRTMVYLYRAVDKAGQTVDFFLSRNRDVNAAKSFLRSAMKSTVSFR
jgi:hypothetical protein